MSLAHTQPLPSKSDKVRGEEAGKVEYKPHCRTEHGCLQHGDRAEILGWREQGFQNPMGLYHAGPRSQAPYFVILGENEMRNPEDSD